jgi:hypothetical protein
LHRKEDFALSLIRKVFWPVAAALALMVFLVATGTTSADSEGQGSVHSNYSYGRHDDGDFCAISGPKVITVGQTYLYAGVLDHWSQNPTTVSLDNIVGSSKITSVLDARDDYTYLPSPGANEINNASNFTTFNLDDSSYGNDGYAHGDLSADGASAHYGQSQIGIDDDVVDLLTAKYGADAINTVLALNTCGAKTTDALTRIIEDAILNGEACSAAATSFTTSCNPVGAHDGTSTAPGQVSLFHDLDIDCPTTGTCTVATAAITNAVNAIAADLANPYLYDAYHKLDCRDVAIDAGKGVILAGAPDSVADQFVDFVQQACRLGFELGNRTGFHHDGFIDSVVLVDVTCVSAGNFDISFTDQREPDDAISMNVICRGPASTQSTIKCTPSPCSVEIIPAVGSISHNLITVTALDSAGQQAGEGSEIDFTVDRCSIESGGVQTKPTYDAANTVFSAYNVNSSATANAIETSPAAVAAVDSSRQADNSKLFDDGTSTLGAAVLGCSPDDANPTATPGVATVTAIIAVTGGQDVVKTVTVTVVGPPFSMTISASPTTVRCGEKSTITVNVKDAIGQNVSDHTRVEAVTNAGGVLGGTGAVANLSGPVVPVSSTVGETFAGQATFYLLTSEAHSGPYEVVVTTGGAGSLGSALGGVFSTPPVVIQTTVTCTLPQPAAAAPAPAPTITAPRTGTGPTILPPNTGDAGLASTSGGSVALFAIVGVVAFAIAGLATVKFARR